MAAIKVRATELCFFDSEMKMPGVEFYLTDIKDEDGKVTVPAEKQFSSKFMVRCDAPRKVNQGETPEQAQAKADAKAADNRKHKGLTDGAAAQVNDPTESPI